MILKAEGNIVYVNDPITVCGDLHGQFHDMIKMLTVGGDPESTKYLFLGDFVDRGIFSVEVLLLVMSLKVKFQNSVFLIRGNHECRQMAISFNFRQECLAKYDQDIYNMFIEMFDSLPISAVINGKFIAIHGGISPELKTLAELNKIDRFKEPPISGILCDMLWSDPVDRPDGSQEQEFMANDQRGCSYYYGSKALNNFLTKNKLLSLIRGHEVQIEGFKMLNWKNKTFPQVITIFSAPNYCDTYNNKGAVIKFEVGSAEQRPEHPAVPLHAAPLLPPELHEHLRLVAALCDGEE